MQWCILCRPGFCRRHAYHLRVTVHSQKGPRQQPDEVQKIREAQVFALVLGIVIARLREQRGWTQSQLAATVSATQSTISRIEAGKAQPDAFLYGKLASAFGMTVQTLDHHVKEAMDTAKRAANAVSNGNKSWDDVIGVVGMIGLIGLIIFAVAALLDGGGTIKVPKVKV
jgi:ribosome-binding protein aMBF1 (putative translation factor)